MTHEQIKEQAGKFNWYHKIELFPGFFTTSRMEPSFPIWDMVRKVRSGLDYRDCSVLDIGTFDGMWAFEAVKLGAKSVTGMDVWDSDFSAKNKAEFANEVLDAGVTFKESSAEEDMSHLGTFDIVQCFGMLYHVENPIQVLRNIRKIINPGGKMILETAYWKNGDDAPAARFNSDDGVYCDPTTFWVLNRPALLGALKLAGFAPIEKSLQLVDYGTFLTHRLCLICELSEPAAVGRFAN